MTRKANRSTSGWTKRYLVHTNTGEVWLVRGRARKHNNKLLYQVYVGDKWRRLPAGMDTQLIKTDAQLVALRLQGIPVKGEPRWKNYTS